MQVWQAEHNNRIPSIRPLTAPCAYSQRSFLPQIKNESTTHDKEIRKRYSRSYTVLSFLTMFSYWELPSAVLLFSLPCGTTVHSPIFSIAICRIRSVTAAGVSFGRRKASRVSLTAIGQRETFSDASSASSGRAARCR